MDWDLWRKPKDTRVYVDVCILASPHTLNEYHCLDDTRTE